MIINNHIHIDVASNIHNDSDNYIELLSMN